MMTERVRTQTKKVTKFDKVVAREVCQVTNRGTQVFGQQVAVSNDHHPNYMLAIAEKYSASATRFGICFIDTSLAEFHIGEFDDDRHCSRLLTLLSHHPPVLVLSERNGLSAKTAQIFKSVLSNALQERLLADTQFWSATKTLKHMAEKYFSPNLTTTEWPAIFRRMQSADDHLGLTADDGWQLALRATGACIWYMSKCLVDAQIMSMAQFCAYEPPDDRPAVSVDDISSDISRKLAAHSMRNRNMVLDSISLANLKITNDEHSLLSTLDNCCSKFGKRLLQHWVCTPSCDRAVIVARQRAIAELWEKAADLLPTIRLALGAVPDLERLLAQIHTFGDGQRKESHPDGRAIFFEQKTYNKKKIQVRVDFDDIFNYNK